MMTKYPIVISHNENIVRGICSPYHVSTKGKLKPGAYDPTPKTDEVSVMRSDWIGSHQCKQQAKKLENLQQQPKKIYQGLAVLSAEEIRKSGADVVDSRTHFRGHADIKLSFQIQPGEPLSPEATEILRERKKKLAELAHYLQDQNPNSDLWNGANLDYLRLKNEGSCN